MKMRFAYAGVVVSGLLTAYADPCWQGQKGSGFIDDESMWSATPAPIYTTKTAADGRNYAQIWPAADWISTVYLKEMAIFNSDSTLCRGGTTR